MALDVKALGSIAALIANGGGREDSQYRDDSEFDQAWDALSRDIAKIRREHPGADIYVDNDWPELD